MSHAGRTANIVELLFHPVSHYDSPDDVLNDATLSIGEKRVILSSWASDMYVVESHPALRQVPGIPHQIHLDDILAALKSLDDDNDPPPRGGLAMRLPRFSKLDYAAPDEPQHFINGQAATSTLELGLDLHHLLIPMTSVVDDCCHDHGRNEQNGA